MSLDTELYKLLRLGLSESAKESFRVYSEDEWNALYSLASKLSVVGIAYAGVNRMPPEFRPPLDIAFQWASEAETIRGHNRLINTDASRLTELFRLHGHRSAILKGAANARLYHDKFVRQCGDIDIWIDGGKDSLVSLLHELNLMEWPDLQAKSGKKTHEELVVEAKLKILDWGHHVQLLPSAAAVSVEAHFKPSSGNRNFLTNRRLMRYLEREIENVECVPEGFCVPSLKFALTMQLSHIQRHFLAGGIGFKQIIDYYVLLQVASDDDRSEVSANLKRFGFSRTCAALMWLLSHVLGLSRDRMLCAPDARRGRTMLDIVMADGNFGYYSGVESRSMVPRWFGRRWQVIRLFSFAPTEIIWSEIDYWTQFLRSIPIRIKLRQISIRELFQ